VSWVLPEVSKDRLASVSSLIFQKGINQ